MILQSFSDYLTTNGKPKNTIVNYISDIKSLFKYLQYDPATIGNIDLQSITFEKLYSYLSNCKQSGMSNSTNSRRISSIKTFFNYLKDFEYVIENPALKLKKPKLEKRLPVYLDAKQCNRAYHKIQVRKEKNVDYDFSERDYCIVKLFLNTGLRASELKNINVDHIKGDELKVIRKGNEEDIVYLNDETIEAIKKYLSVREKTDNKALFLSCRNNRLDYSMIRKIVHFYTGVSPHKLRHTFASNAAKTIPLPVLQGMMNHKNIATTMIYTHINNEDKKKAAKSISI